MIERLTNSDSIKAAESRIRELIDGHGEWLCARSSQATAMPLLKSECDVRISHGRLIFSCWGGEGTLVWRVNGWEWTGETLVVDATRRLGAERAVIELMPRAAA